GHPGGEGGGDPAEDDSRCGFTPAMAEEILRDPVEAVARRRIDPELIIALSGCPGITWGSCPTDEQIEQIVRDYVQPVVTDPLHAFERWDGARSCFGEVGGHHVFVTVGAGGELEIGYLPDAYGVDSYLCWGGDQEACERAGDPLGD
ncbi:MAG TPA: hypothetical protein VKZ63_02665, partial [Kofleriaceae bacterium]|nr:hypothetical protein [Kofleriaceae bacterium]